MFSFNVINFNYKHFDMAIKTENTKENTTENTKTHYSEAELQEFREIILKKLDSAKEEYDFLQTQINQSSEELAEARSAGLDNGSITSEKENLNKMAARQVKYIKHLENALIRIENKSYGICRITNKLISKARLKVVPHATLSIEAKNARRD